MIMIYIPYNSLLYIPNAEKKKINGFFIPFEVWFVQYLSYLHVFQWTQLFVISFKKVAAFTFKINPPTPTHTHTHLFLTLLNVAYFLWFLNRFVWKCYIWSILYIFRNSFGFLTAQKNWIEWNGIVFLSIHQIDTFVVVYPLTF